MKNHLRYSGLLLMLISTGIYSCRSDNTSQPQNPEAFSLSAVRLLDSPFLNAEKLNEAYVLAHEPDRLLAPFLSEAGLTPKAPRYGNWENSGLDGHTAGHYLSALAMMVAGSNNEEAKKRLDYMVEQLALAQKTNGDGYVGGVPDGQKIWEEIAAGRMDVDDFSLNGRWVPWYNLHKLYAGLRDAWLFAENRQALEVLIELTDWAELLVSGLDDEDIQNMLTAEHGGINEVFADVYDITGDERYLQLAIRFSHHKILDPLLSGEDKLTGLHANTQIPKVIGFKRIADVASLNNSNAGIDANVWSDAAAFFWETVVENRSVSIGGHSVHEFFHPKDDFSSMMTSREGPETCNTSNMMRLSRMLFHSTGDLKYIDFYERALYNHILSSQHPGHGGLVYFSPMRPGHYRVYSNPEHTFWCCVGTGIENHARYGELIYSHGGQNVYINLFISSELIWEEKGVKLIQKTAFPESEQTELVLHMDVPRQFVLHSRFPGWLSEEAMDVKVNGLRVDVSGRPGGYVAIDRVWNDGDRVSIHMPMHTYGEYLPDGSSYMSILHGPVVLAAEAGTDGVDGLVSDDSRMGHIASGPLYPRHQLPVLIMDDADTWLSKLYPIEGEPLAFDASEVMANKNENEQITLVPFYRLHDARYVVYWPTVSSDSLEYLIDNIGQQETESMALEAQTIDFVTPGQQQPESDHHFQGEQTQTGIHDNRHSRRAYGWFSYDLNDPGYDARVLRLTYFGEDSGRHFDIFFNGHHIAEVKLEGEQGDRFFHVNYGLPAWVVEGVEEPIHTVRFEAKDGASTANIYDVRIMK